MAKVLARVGAALRSGLGGAWLAGGTWGLAALTATGCAQEHWVGSAGFRAQRTVDAQLVGLRQPILASGDLDGDGRADVAVLDADARRLCLLYSQADPAAQAESLSSPSCETLSESDAPQQVVIARLVPGGRAQLVLAGRSLLLFPPLTRGALPAPRLRLPLLSPVQRLVVQRLPTPAAGSGYEIIWSIPNSAAASSPEATAWAAASLDSNGQSAAQLAAAAYPLPSQPSAFLPHTTAAGQRQIFVASDRGIDLLQSRGDSQALPCPARFADSQALAVVDGNDDGRADLLALRPDGRPALLLRAADDSAFDGSCSSDVATPLADQALLQLLPADFDGDGRIDLAATSPDRDPGLLLWRSGQPVLRYPLSTPAQAATLAFLNADTRADVVLLLRDGTLLRLVNTFPL